MNKLKSLFNFLFSKKDIQDSKSLEINIRTKKDFEFHFPTPDPDSDVWDVFAAIIEPVVIPPGECKWIPLGFYCDMPQGHVFELKSIFSLTIDKYITVVSAPIVDHLYRDEVGVVLTNFGKYDFTVAPNMCVAKGVFYQTSNTHIRMDICLPTNYEGMFQNAKPLETKPSFRPVVKSN